MAYLSSFEYDIFISYARVDDQKPPGKDKGWITLFHEYLEIELSKRFGRVGVVKIWRDTREIGGSTFFDEAIETGINKSGLFLALTSRGYFNPESYCLKELKSFHNKARADAFGLKIDARSRLFNILLYNILPDDWPVEMAGTSGLPFHDAQRKDQVGLPSHQDGELFERQLRQLVDEIQATLEALKKIVEPKPPVPDPNRITPEDNPFSIFLAHAEGDLRGTRRRVVEELRQNGLQVVTDLPPPYPALQHEKVVIDEISRAGLSVHLLDGASGTEVQDEPDKTYYQKQVEIGKQHARSQLIWIPKTLDIQTIEDEGQRNFLAQLENGDRDQSTYRFIRESSGSIAREILAEVNRIQAEKKRTETPPSAALVDTHLKDQLYALDLGKFLLKRKVMPFISPEEDDPQKNIALFQEMLKRVSILIIIFGQVAGDWVRERLISALQIAIADRCSLKFCGIYLAPIDGQGEARQISLGVFPGSVPVFLFDKPEILANLLDTFVGR